MNRTLRARTRRATWALLSASASALVAFDGVAASLPTVASINLCADQHVLALADPEQILTVSWLAADASESMLAATARNHAHNYGTAEELLALAPDVVIAGTYTSPFSRSLLQRVGYRVVELEPENSIADIERNVRMVASAIGQAARGEQHIAALRADVDAIAAGRPEHRLRTVVVRAGGFTVGAQSLAHELIVLSGMRNVAAEQGLDRWGSLSMETLLRSAPELIVLTDYRPDEPSLANAVLEHPALAKLAAARTSVAVPAALWACGLPRSLESAALLQRAAAR
jgi:iron complex transport system substrate-binding protein